MSTRLLTLVTFSPALINGQRKKGVREGRRERWWGRRKKDRFPWKDPWLFLHL